MARDIDEDSGRPFIKVNHPAPGDVVRDPAHVAGYETAFEGTISLRIRDDDGTVIAEGSTQGGSNGVIGEFKANLEFDRKPNQRLGVVEAFEGERQWVRRRPPFEPRPDRLRLAGVV
jgi:hypothetical protein